VIKCRQENDIKVSWRQQLQEAATTSWAGKNKGKVLKLLKTQA
jgi:hypothetical protein